MLPNKPVTRFSLASKNPIVAKEAIVDLETVTFVKKASKMINKKTKKAKEPKSI